MIFVAEMEQPTRRSTMFFNLVVREPHNRQNPLTFMRLVGSKSSVPVRIEDVLPQDVRGLVGDWKRWQSGSWPVARCVRYQEDGIYRPSVARNSEKPADSF